MLNGQRVVTGGNSLTNSKARPVNMLRRTVKRLSCLVLHVDFRHPVACVPEENPKHSANRRQRHDPTPVAQPWSGVSNSITLRRHAPTAIKVALNPVVNAIPIQRRAGLPARLIC
jgi:hypothetical protein